MHIKTRPAGRKLITDSQNMDEDMGKGQPKYEHQGAAEVKSRKEQVSEWARNKFDLHCEPPCDSHGMCDNCYEIHLIRIGAEWADAFPPTREYWAKRAHDAEAKLATSEAIIGKLELWLGEAVSALRFAEHAYWLAGPEDKEAFIHNHIESDKRIIEALEKLQKIRGG